MKKTIKIICYILSVIVTCLAIYNLFLFTQLIFYPEIVKSKHSTIYYLFALAGYFLFALAEAAFAYFLYRLAKSIRNQDVS